MLRQHVIVHGQVQGVGFRYHSREQANRLGLAGFARNLADGTVEVEIEGDDTDVAAMLDWLAKGPDWAVVSNIEVRDIPLTGETSFSIR